MTGDRIIHQMAFLRSFEEMQKDAFEINQAHGFNEPDDLIQELNNFLLTWGADSGIYVKYKPAIANMIQARTGLRLALIMSELGEALEGVRKNNPPDSHIPEFSSEEAELADAVIRIMNLATSNKCRLAEAIVAKQNYNRNRPYKHGNKVF